MDHDGAARGAVGAVAETDLLAPGTPIDLDNCDREALHLAGAVQPHGVLVTCSATAPHAVLQRSANVAAYGATGESDTLATLVGAANVTRLLQHAPADGPPGLRPLRLEGDGALSGPVDAIAYAPRPGLLAVELEPADSTGDTGATAAADSAISALGALADAGSSEELLDRAVGALRDLTGYDRVWAYRFEPDGHGVVVAESAIAGLESFLGLHYPASDIPAPARALFLRNAVRIIADVHAEAVPITPQRDPETGTWLDLSDSALRAVSPMHLAYLRAMGVRASMSVALRVDGTLWGLLSAHHYAGPLRPSAAVRARAELVGQVTSMQLRLLADLAAARDRITLDGHAAALLAHVAQAESLLDGLAGRPADLLGLAAADGAIVALAGEVRTVGDVPEPEAIPELLSAVSGLVDGDGRVAVADLPLRVPGLGCGPKATGVIGFALSRARREWILWLRGPYEGEVTWAHGDKELVRRELGGGTELGPRASYTHWSEAMRDRARPWSAAERASVGTFRQALATFVIARAEELATVNAELERSNEELEAFAFAAAHDLQEPLRGIHNFTTFLVEDHGEDIGSDGIEMTDTILRLAERSTALLHALLQFARAGREPLRPAPLQLGAVLAEVEQMLHAPITQRGADLRLVADGALTADATQFEQVVMNLVANATKYGGEQPQIRVGVRAATAADGPHAGPGDARVLFVEDDGVGIAPEHQTAIFEIFRRLHARDEYGGGSGAGLAIVARIAHRHGGRAWVESAPGAGARFCVLLPEAAG